NRRRFKCGKIFLVEHLFILFYKLDYKIFPDEDQTVGSQEYTGLVWMADYRGSGYDTQGSLCGCPAYALGRFSTRAGGSSGIGLAGPLCSQKITIHGPGRSFFPNAGWVSG